MNKKTILYLGNFLNKDIVVERKLPTYNIAGSNRMIRISEALSLNYDVKIISPAITLRNKIILKKLCLNKKSTYLNGIEIIFAKTVAIPVLGLIVSHFTYAREIFKNIKTYKIENIIIYNYESINFFILLFLKTFFSKIKIWNNIEDISVINYNDLKHTSEDNFFKQALLSLFMKVTAYLSDGYIVLSPHFLNYLPKKNNTVIISGCMNVKKENVLNSLDDINILFSGKIAFEHGIKEFVEFIERYKTYIYNNNININITGFGPKSNWLLERLNSVSNSNIKYHGFVDDETYRELLTTSTICVALQKPDGRHAKLKTPSKVYEYLGNSKIVIATDVGDFKSIDKKLIRICHPLNALNLFKIIEEIIIEKNNICQVSQKVYQFAFDNYDYSNVSKKLV